MSDEFDVENVPAIAISFDTTIDQGRIIRFQTGVAQDAPASAISALIDKLVSVADRQEARYKLQALQTQIEQEEKLYVERQEDLVRIDAEAKAQYEAGGRRAGWSPDKLPPARLQERSNADTFVKRLRDAIIAKRAEAEKVKAIVDGAHFATNSH